MGQYYEINTKNHSPAAGIISSAMAGIIYSALSGIICCATGGIISPLLSLWALWKGVAEIVVIMK